MIHCLRGALSAASFATIVAMSVLALPTTALAQSEETFVSRSGSDSNSCVTPTSPCRQISAALAKTFPDGTVFVEPGTYSSFRVTKAVSILADPQALVRGDGVQFGGLQAGVHVSAGPEDVVLIRGLTIYPQRVGATVGFLSGRALIIEQSTLNAPAFETAAIAFVPNAPATGGPSRLLVRNSLMKPVGAGGVLLRPTNGVSVSAVFDNVTVTEATYGIKADGGGQSAGQIDVEVRSSVAAHNSTNGFIAVSNPGQAQVRFKITNSSAADNLSYGAVATGAQAFMIVDGGSLTKNGTGLAQLNGATVASYGNNAINFNTTNTAGTITAIPLK